MNDNTSHHGVGTGLCVPWWVFSAGSGSHATADGLNDYRDDVAGDEDLEVQTRGDETVLAAVLGDHSTEDVVYASAKEARS